MLAGLTITGIWQFFAHESDPAWFDHIVGSSTRQRASTSSGVGALHGTFSTAAGALALLGGAWFAYKIIFDVSWVAVFAVVTDKWDLGTTAIWVLTLSHVLALPVLPAIAWFSLPRVEDPRR